MRSEEPKNTPQQGSSDQRNASKKAKNQASKKVTEARASAQRAKLDAQAEERKQEAAEVTKPKGSKGLLFHKRSSLSGESVMSFPMIE